MERRTFTRSLLAVPLGIAALSAALPAAADDDDDDDDDGRSQRSPFTDIPVLGTVGGAPFRGKFTIRSFKEAAGALVAVGRLEGVSTRNGRFISHRFDAVEWPATLEGFAATRPGVGGAQAEAEGELSAAQAPPSCPILNLVLGPLNLNLLGLVVSIPNPIIINITAVPGPSNLLGNLLCAVVGLLNPGGTLTQIIGFLNALLALLNA